MNLAEILNAGGAAHQAGNLAQAEAHYQTVLRAMPAEFNALHLMGVVRLQQNRLPEAVDFLRKAVAQNPQVPVAQFNLGLALTSAGRHAEALAAFDATIALDPQAGDAHEARGNALAQLNRNVQAVAAWQAALARAPQSLALLTKTGRALVALNRHGDAIEPLKRALAMDPKSVDIMRDFMACVAHLGRFADGLAAVDKALAVAPNDAELLCGRGLMLQALGEHAESLASLERALTLAPNLTSVLAESLRVRAYNCDWKDDGARDRLRANIAAGEAIDPMTAMELLHDPETLLANARTFIAQRVPAQPPLWRGKPYRHDRIRIAYLSADFCSHVVATVLVDLIERHDRGAFEVHGLSFGPDDRSALRGRFMRAFDTFTDVSAWSDRQIAEWLVAHEIDVAVDITGHAPHGRPGVMAFRGAPVQVSYLGFPITRGAPFIDYVIGDRYATPAADQVHYTEKFAVLPNCYMAGDSHRPAPPSPPTRKDVGLPESGFVYCCFNQPFKITAEIFAVWTRLLQRAPGSVLWMRCDREVAQANLRRFVADRGVDPARLVFAPRASDAAHQARHALADLFLDTPDYNAHTTAIDALWAGLPVLTTPGQTVVGRVAASILHAAGLPELVADSLQAYEETAVALANDPARLGALRTRAVAARTSSTLFDSARTCRDLEAAYTRMVAIAHAGGPPQTFAVES